MTARRLTRIGTAAAATAVAMVLMARASAAPLPYRDGGAARLRLSWSARPERIEGCHQVSAEELERREEHMRQRIECDGRFATYLLRVEADGRTVDETVVRGSGLRHDRPLYLLRDFDLSSGTHRVRVSFTRRERADRDDAQVASDRAADADTGIFTGRADRERVEHARRARAAMPPRLVLDTIMTFAPGRVIVVTFDSERKTLEVLGRAAASR
jgi:hypothetical protein